MMDNTSKPEMAFFDVSGEPARDWYAYRLAYVEWEKAMMRLADDIGASRINHMGGRIIGAVFEKERHPAFEAKSNRHGAHWLRKRGNTTETRAAADFVTGRNAELSALYPNAHQIASKHGFKSSVDYREKDGKFTGCRVIGDAMDRVQVLWTSLESPITIYAPDLAAAIYNERQRGHIVDTPDWPDPEGYTRILPEEWKLREATAALEKAKRAPV